MRKAESVDVIVITCNHELYIRECIESVLGQTDIDNIAIKVFDDASDDRTCSIVKSIAKNENKVSLLRTEPRRGVYDAFMHALKSAEAEYVAVLEGDDYWIDANKILHQKNALMRSSQDVSFSFTDYSIVDKSGEIIRKLGIAGEWDRIYNYGHFEKWLIPPTGSLLYRNTGIEYLRVNKYPPYAGDVYLLEALLKHGMGVYVDKPMVAYRQTHTGVYSSLNYCKRLNAATRDMINIYVRNEEGLSQLKNRIINNIAYMLGCKEFLDETEKMFLREYVGFLRKSEILKMYYRAFKLIMRGAHAK